MATMRDRVDTERNLVRIEPHRGWYRVTRVYLTDDEKATAIAHAEAGDINVGFALRYGGGTLAGRGWRQWDGVEQLEVGDEISGVACLCDEGSFLS